MFSVGQAEQYVLQNPNRVENIQQQSVYTLLACSYFTKVSLFCFLGFLSRDIAILCIMHRASCIMHHAPCTMHHAPCTMHHASCKEDDLNYEDDFKNEGHLKNEDNLDDLKNEDKLNNKDNPQNWDM